MLTDRMRAAVRRLVDAAPPVSPEWIDRLASLLRPADGAATPSMRPRLDPPAPAVRADPRSAQHQDATPSAAPVDPGP